MKTRGYRYSIGLLGLVALTIVGCAHKSPKDALSADGTNGGAEISSTPLEYDNAGSDSQKIEGLSTIHFKYDSGVIDQDARKILSQNYQWLKKHPNTALSIEGHCDQRGSTEYNMALGERRAKSAKAYLVALGANKDDLSTISYGKERPIAVGDSENDYAKNRRDNFVPVLKVKNNQSMR